MATPQKRQPLSLAFLTTIWVFQLVAAGPIFIWLGLAAIFNLFYTFDRAYDFITHLCTSLFAASIFFIVLVQRKIGDRVGRRLTLRFEIAKSGFATALWIWLMLDAVFGPEDHYGYSKTRQTRVIAAGFSVVLLFILFYPTVFFVVTNEELLASQSDDAEAAGEDQGERQRLLP